MSKIPILATQLSPPAVKERFVRRAKLNQKLRLIQKYPLTLIHSGAGYGKSTALSLFLQDTDIDACWYSISQYDDDFVPFITKIIHSMRKAQPSFGERILNELHTIDHYVHDQEVWSIMTMMVNEISKLNKEVILVLDDFHHLSSSSAIESWMQHFVEHFPDQLHLVISSRRRPKWSILTQLKVKGNLLEVDQDDLLLSYEEMEHLLIDIYELSVNEDEVKGIHQTTEGWAIACGMFVQQLRTGVNANTILQKQKRSLQDLFDYLVMEVLSKQSPIVQKFLEQTSVLEVLSADSCDAVLGMTGSISLLEDLSSQNLFIQSIDDEHYRYHALFKAFLESRMKKQQPEEYFRLNQRAARFFEQNGDVENAIFHYEQIKADDRAAYLLSDYGRTMLASGKLQALYDRLLHIPDREKDYFPILWYFEGEVLRYRSKYKEAESCYDRAIEEGERRQNLYTKSLAFEGKARIYLDTIQPDQAERILQSAIEIREKLDVKNEEKARLYHMLGENLLNSGQAKKAEAWFEKAKDLNLPLDDSNLEARLYLRTGRLLKARQVLQERKEKFSLPEDKSLPQSHRETDILLSIIESFMGNALESKMHAQKGIEYGMSTESPFVEACGWIRMGHAVQLLNRYKPNLAIQCYNTALELMEKLNVSRGKAEPYMGLCILYGMQQEYEKALETGQKGLYETEKVKDLWLSSLIQLCMSISAIYCERYDYAAELLKETEQNFHHCDDEYGLMLTSFWKAYLASKKKDEETFSEEINIFLRRMQVGSYEFFIKSRTTFGPMDLQSIIPLLFKAQKQEIHSNYVTKLMYELGYGELSHHPGYTLRIQTLGCFHVWLGNKRIYEQDWQRGKARELLELFVAKQNKLLPKEEIFQQLWPDLDEESANKSFKVALNALLKTLEPNREARADSFFIKRSATAYGLNPSSGYELDITEFEKWITEGLEKTDPGRTREILKKGLDLYEGDFLPDRRTTDWCLMERERLQVLFLRGAEKMAQVSVRLEDYDTCIYWCEKILNVDITWEEAYRLIMYSYYQKNNRPQAIKWYQKCYNTLIEELGVEPMKPTREMFEMIKEASGMIS
ncbi:DNA-binding SARP family transcriptional activator [Salirhabdus euzebyi]|uniref:DNA-binding SARP family transcriptional activator n=1 Tax=Salirhabdus euzebyi TaxID=394506 RepID=A0A841Q745_9BACI|nr:BTAD domain-containing putative transcriptional regulator [Salirhabdus euzebyi]MBB6454164.1 DNA-binding SARP family transcriptional activator [Salirhabdus euzebyi]